MYIDSNYMKSVCEIKTMTNDLLAVGRLSRIDEEIIEISATDGSQMPLGIYNTVVKIDIINSELGFLMLTGRVVGSTANFWRLTSIKNLHEFERRNFFRAKTNSPGKVHSIRSTSGATYEEGLEIPIILENVSLCGVLLCCREIFHKGDEFILEVRIMDGYYILPCHVRRFAGETHRGKLYGCSFADLPEKTMDNLCRDLFTLQRQEMWERRSRE